MGVSKMEKECGNECGSGQTDCQCPCHTCGAPTCSGCANMHGGKACPIEMTTMMWKKAFFTAHMEVEVEKLKERIEANWGPLMDKVADAVIEAMGKQWQAMLQDAGADKELNEKVAKIFSEGRKN